MVWEQPFLPKDMLASSWKVLWELTTGEWITLVCLCYCNNTLEPGSVYRAQNSFLTDQEAAKSNMKAWAGWVSGNSCSLLLRWCLCRHTVCVLTWQS